MVILVPILWALSFQSLYAGTFAAFGPEVYARTTSTPTRVAKNFSVLNASTSYTLRIQFPKGSAADISINGLLIFSATEEFKKPTLIERPVTLQPTNEIVVTNKGKPGTSISVEVRGLDNDLPSITPTPSPLPNAKGWNNTAVTVSFTCDDRTSGIASCPAPITLSSEGAGQVVSGTAVDRAGNTAIATVTLNIDKTPPVVTPTVTPPPNLAGWNNTDVSVSFGCDDALSGVMTCPGPIIVGSEGADQVVSGPAMDNAGNVSSSGVTLNVDKTPPTFSDFQPAPCPTPIMDARPIVMACFADALSGVDPSSVRLLVDGFTLSATVQSGCIGFAPSQDLQQGLHQTEIQATDIAGNAGVEDSCFSIQPPTSLDVRIDSPTEGLLTSASFLDVAGHVEQPPSPLAQVLVNGVPGVITGSSFLAQGVVLREGVVELTATATDVSGRTGTATITVTRDTSPPRLVISAPRDGGVLASPITDVAGEVNDTVVGTVNANNVAITVNGVPAQVMNRGFRAQHVLVDPNTGNIVASAIDGAGNQASASIKVKVSAAGSRRILEISGNDQMAQVGQLLTDPLVVELRDELDNPVSGEMVVFRVSHGDGTFDTGERTLALPTDASGRASTGFRLGGRFGMGNNRVEASAVGFAGRVFFTENATQASPDKLHIVSGNGQVGVVGQRLPRPFTVIVSDAQHNSIENVPITFRVTDGGGHFENGADEIVVPTDSDGWARALLSLGPMEGNENNVVEASFAGLAKLPARFSASGRVPGPAQDTRVVGIVLDNSDAPIPGATISIHGTNLVTTTDADGRFNITGTPVGTIHLEVDGSTTSRVGDWPALSFQIVTVAGRDNDMGRPIYLPQLTTQVAAVSETQGGVCTLSSVPGFRLEIAPGSATFADGTKTGVVSVTQVHPDKVPMPPPMGARDPIVVSIMPPDVHFSPPAPMTIPNFEGLKPGETAEMYSFDHDLGMFISIGTATVTEDGAFLVSDPGQGIIKGGWHCGGQPSGSNANVRQCNDDNPCTVDSCDPLTGQCLHTSAANPVAHIGAAVEAGQCPPNVCSECVPNTLLDECEIGICNPSTGMCEIRPRPKRTRCTARGSDFCRVWECDGKAACLVTPQRNVCESVPCPSSVDTQIANAIFKLRLANVQDCIGLNYVSAILKMIVCGGTPWGSKQCFCRCDNDPASMPCASFLCGSETRGIRLDCNTQMPEIGGANSCVQPICTAVHELLHNVIGNQTIPCTNDMQLPLPPGVPSHEEESFITNLIENRCCNLLLVP